MQGTEQAEIEVEETSSQPEASVESISDILGNALKGSQATPEDSPEAGQTQKVEQTQEADEPPFLELLIDPKTKLPIKSEDEFIEFLERNPVLKEGWLRQSDYTRKTQEISEARKEFEARQKADEEFWGKGKPDQGSMEAFRNLWTVFQGGDSAVQDSILQFVNDVNLLAKGQAPVGPLAALSQGGQNQSAPELLPLQNEIAKLKQELQQFRGQSEAEKKAALERQQAEVAQKAEAEVDTWVTAKEKSGVKITQDDFEIMADLMSILGKDGKPKMTLDEAYDLAQAKQGKTKASVARQVLQSANNLSKKTPKAPASKISSAEEPEPKTVLGILQQGVNSLS